MGNKLLGLEIGRKLRKVHQVVELQVGMSIFMPLYFSQKNYKNVYAAQQVVSPLFSSLVLAHNNLQIIPLGYFATPSESLNYGILILLKAILASEF